MTSPRPTTPLGDHLRRLMAQTGPIGVARWMAECLGHPRHGYYMTRDPLGAAGDFTTAPEISQMFGELIGLALADAWQRQGAPDRATLVELGPGRGTLMADAWRAMAMAPGLHRAARIELVETSPVLRRHQADALPGLPVRWVDDVDALSDGPILLVANEFFDALPIRQFVHTDGGWRERMVAWDDAAGRFAFALAPGGDPAVDAIAPSVRAAATVGDVAEVCQPGLTIMTAIARRIAAHGGRAIIVDYGPARSGPGDTLQAIRGHAYVDPLAEPGACDLTAHVDFARLVDAARQAGADVTGPVAQGDLLRGLGIDQRARTLKRTASPAQAEAIDSALARLTGMGARQMGALFKALIVDPPETG